MSSLQYLEVVFCFSLTELTSFLLSFVLWSFQVLGKDSMDYGIRSGNSLSLGMPKAPKIIFKKSQASKLGDAPVGIPPFFFNNYRLVSVDPKFFASSRDVCYLRMSFSLALLAVWIKYPDLKFLNERESSHSYIII